MRYDSLATGNLPTPKANVLLVDDDPVSLLALEAILEHAGYNLVTAQSGEEALRLVQEREFAVVLLDIQMPGLDGFQTAKEIRRREHDTHTPIVFITAYEDSRFSVQEAYALGAVDYLMKPVVPVILRAKVAGFIDLFRKTEQIKAQAEQLRWLERQRFEQKLADENARFRALTENSSEAVTLVSPDGTVLYTSPSGRHVLGYEAGEFLGRSGFEIIHPDDRERVTRRFAELVQMPVSTVTAEMRILHKDGSWRWVECVGTNLLNEPAVRAVVINYRDISERHRATEALRESEQRLRAIIDNWPALIFVKDLEGRFLLANRACSRYAGEPPEGMIGRTDQDFLPAQTAERFRAEDRRVLECGKAVRYEEAFPLEGETRHLLTVKFPLCDTSGSPYAVCGIATDITDLKRAEETVRSLLRVSERLNSSLDVDTLLDVLAEEATRLVNAESGVAGLRTPEGMVCQRYLQRGSFLPLEYRWPPMHGLPGWLLVHKVPYLTNDAASDTQIVRELCERYEVRSALSTPILNAEKEILGFFEIHNRKGGGFTPADQEILVAVSQVAAIAIQNALAYRQVREAEHSLKEADRRKNEFLAMLAHELRNPLASVRNAAGVLHVLGLGDPKLQRAREVIERQVRHLTRMVDDLLDVSRITRGKVFLHRERLDLARLVRVTAEDSRPAFDQAGLGLTVTIPEIPVWVEGDSTRLTQVFDNLLQNALKFTPNGGLVDVRVEADGAWATVRVRDTGTGIEAEMGPRLFETFTQADRSLDRSKGGLGLGLALVKGLAELHGGEVSAHSEGPGSGAEFVVRLPRQAEPAAVTTIPAAAAPAARRQRVLVVEDNTDAAESLRILLELYGHEVAVAHTGPAGLEAAAAWHPEVVLCDIGLPGMSGYEVVEELRRRPATAAARIIAVTGYGHEDDRRKSREAGFDQHLVKPVDPAVLRNLLAQPA